MKELWGKTVESFRIALEGEISRWSGFDRALRKADGEAFNELIYALRSYASVLVTEPDLPSVKPEPEIPQETN